MRRIYLKCKNFWNKILMFLLIYALLNWLLWWEFIICHGLPFFLSNELKDKPGNYYFRFSPKGKTYFIDNKQENINFWKIILLTFFWLNIRYYRCYYNTPRILAVITMQIVTAITNLKIYKLILFWFFISLHTLLFLIKKCILSLCVFIKQKNV